MYIASRAHGNAIEYIPTGIGLILAIISRRYPPWMNYLMLGFTLSRFLFTFGLLGYANMNKPNIPRFFGALGTYLFGIGLAGCIGYLSFND